MPHAQALVLTPDPCGAAERLSRHLQRDYETEWGAEAGYVRIGDGFCTFHSWPEGVRFDAFAAASEILRNVEGVVARAVESEGLTIDWRRRPLAEIG
jgi:hypothetical protein